MSLIDGSWGSAPETSFAILDRYLDAGGNAALLSVFGEKPGMVRAVFIHSRARTFFDDWASAADGVVHAPRLNAGLFPSDPDILAVVGEPAGCAGFTARWNSQGSGRAASYRQDAEPPRGRPQGADLPDLRRP